jgi:hypothetical protein
MRARRTTGRLRKHDSLSHVGTFEFNFSHMEANFSRKSDRLTGMAANLTTKVAAMEDTAHTAAQTVDPYYPPKNLGGE